MYTPSYFKMNDPNEMHEMIEAHGFAILASTHQGSLTATHLPLLLNEEKTELIGHFAKGNRQWTDIEGQDVLVVFHGPHCYISPSWYETQETVPTWNYVTVHVTGKVRLFEDKDSRIWQSMIDLTEKYEDPTSTYDLNNVDQGYMDSLSKGVVGFAVSIDKMEGKAKLSQNHSKERIQRVVDSLMETGKAKEKEIAEWMKMKSLTKD